MSASLRILLFLFPALGTLTEKVDTMSNDLTALQATVDALKAKADETAATLKGLADAVIALQGAQPQDLQPVIDALTAKAQGVLDTLTAAEDAADDQLPAP